MISRLDIKPCSRVSHPNKTWYLHTLSITGSMISSITKGIAPLYNHEVIQWRIRCSISGWVWTDFIHTRSSNKVASLSSQMPSPWHWRIWVISSSGYIHLGQLAFILCLRITITFPATVSSLTYLDIQILVSNLFSLRASLIVQLTSSDINSALILYFPEYQKSSWECMIWSKILSWSLDIMRLSSQEIVPIPNDFRVLELTSGLII